MTDSQPNLVLQLLRDMREDMGVLRAQMATRDDVADLRSDMHSLRADVASDLHRLDNKLDVTRKELSEQVVGLRRAVVDYHSSVIGHGAIIADLEARMRRVEQRLGLDEH